MSLLIKGMDIPTACEWCRFISGSLEWYCEVGQFQIYDYKTVHKDCPLVKIPTPHGRLIDADAHIQSLKENQCGERCRKNHDCVNCGIGMYIRIVENEPTVIEAEE